jgi:hypothetical protein
MDLREVSQDGLPSPVSIRRRVGPWPIRYVFVPVLWEFLVSWNDFFFLDWIGVGVLLYLGE